MLQRCVVSLFLVLAGCSPDPVAVVDAGADAAIDASSIDGGHEADAGDLDGGDLDGGELDAGDLDAGDLDAGEPDAGEPDAATCPTPLLVGGTDLATQGWSTVMQTPATLTYGADYVELSTSTAAGARTSGQLLLTLADAVMPGIPFRLEVVMLVASVSPHNSLDSGAAILGSFTPPFGNAVDRSEMIYLDAAAIGWSDDTASFSTAVTDGAYHTYVLDVDASGTATVSIDGAVALTRSGYTTTGTIAIGDQTNDANVDATVRIRSVSLLCP